MFELELSYIQNEKLRKSVMAIVNIYEQELRDYPASISGMYHPPEERGPGGLALHIARICRIIHDNLGTHLGLTQDETDLLLVATFLHDLSNLELSKRTRLGTVVRDHDRYSEWHAELSWTYAWPILELHGWKADDPLMLQLKGMMESHMGVWMPNSKMPTRRLELIFTLLDYIDTRTYVHVEVELDD